MYFHTTILIYIFIHLFFDKIVLMKSDTMGVNAIGTLFTQMNSVIEVFVIVMYTSWNSPILRAITSTVFLPFLLIFWWKIFIFFSVLLYWRCPDMKNISNQWRFTKLMTHHPIENYIFQAIDNSFHPFFSYNRKFCLLKWKVHDVLTLFTLMTRAKLRRWAKSI